MENASKALLIAAAVLIVILIIAFGIKIYTSTSGTQKVTTDTGRTISQKTGDAKDLAVSEITGKKVNKNIKYYQNLGESNENEITVEEAVPGNSIKIGSEQFMIFFKTSTEIKAIPYYNIELRLDNPIQSASAGECKFSDRAYWIYDENGQQISNWNANTYDVPYYTSVLDLDMRHSNIQQYINAYNQTLKNMAGNAIVARAGKLSELASIPFENREWKNPSNIGVFWLGSAYAGKDVYGSQSTSLYGVNRESGGINYRGLGYSYTGSNGGIWQNYYHSTKGVRPIIIISI